LESGKFPAKRSIWSVSWCAVSGSSRNS